MGSHTCMVTLMGQVSTAQPEHKVAFSSKTHLVSSKVSSIARQGHWRPLLGISLQGPRCARRAAPQQKRHWGAATQPQQPERDTAGTLGPPGLFALHNSISPSATGKDMPVFLVALQSLRLLRGTTDPSSLPHKFAPLATHPWHPSPATGQPFSPLPGPQPASPDSWHSVSSTG